MVYLHPSDGILKATVSSINATTSTWGLGPLSSKWLFLTGDLPKDTQVGNYFYYDGSVDSVGDWIVVQRKPVGHVGTLPLTSFVYLMISVMVVLALILLPNCKYIIRLLLGGDSRFGTDSISADGRLKGLNNNSTSGPLSAYAFDRHLKHFYPPPQPSPLPSYLEVVDPVLSEPSRPIRPSDIRDTQGMLRKIYALKVDAFNARDVRRANQDVVLEWKNQATAGLRDVQGVVEMWARRRDWTDEEKTVVDEIRRRVVGIQPDA